MMHFRRVAHDKDHFDLLPVIAIFICLMGTLLLVTISVASLSIGPGAGEGWLPVSDPSAKSKIPVLIEWDGTYATCHQGKHNISGEWHDWVRNLESNGQLFSVGKDDASPELMKLLEDLQNRKATHYALFAVRPSGFHNFNLFVAKFRDLGISVGYEPIAQDRQVKLLQRKESQP